MVRYMLLIYGERPTAPSAEQWWAYERAVTDAGIKQASEALRGVDTATTVRVREDGEMVITVGPFAQTREVLGGYYVLDVPDFDTALEWAARCPVTKYGGCVEVRPITEHTSPT